MSEIEYKDICRYLKRYSFEEKIRMCHKYSRALIDGNGDVSVEEMTRMVYPWEIETFLLLAIHSTPEYAENTFEGKKENKFIEMINAIRFFEHPKLLQEKGSTRFIDLFFASTGLSQFDIQETKHYKMFRFKYFFTFQNEKIDMKIEFKKCFGTEYKEFLELGSFLTLVYGSNLNIDNRFLDYIAIKCFPLAFLNLTIDLDEYKKQLNAVTTEIEDYVTCLRPSFKYPFILREEKIYFPLPHLLIRSITSSLLYRMTEGNNKIRSIIGKEVLEEYLYDILKNSCAYEEVYRENSFYIEHHQEVMSLDIMARQGNEYLFVDSKMAVPSAKVRVFDIEYYQNEVSKLADQVIQVYKHLNFYLPKYMDYTSFEIKPMEFNEKIWGIVAILEDGFIRRESIYQLTAAKLNIAPKSKEYEWMTTHIKVESFYDIERYALTGRSLIDALKQQKEKGKFGDYSLPNYEGKKYKTKSKAYGIFIDELKRSFENIVQKLVEDKVIV